MARTLYAVHMTQRVEEPVDIFAEPVTAPAAIVQRAEVLPAKSLDKQALDKIKSVEDRLYSKALEVVEGALCFADLDPDKHAEGPPEEWIAELGLEGAYRKWRLAMGALLDAKNAAVGFKMATGLVAAITKARASEKGGSHTLNAQVLQINLNMPQFPVREVEQDK